MQIFHTFQCRQDTAAKLLMFQIFSAMVRLLHCFATWWTLNCFLNLSSEPTLILLFCKGITQLLDGAIWFLSLTDTVWISQWQSHSKSIVYLTKVQVVCLSPCWLLSSLCKRFHIDLQNLLFCIHLRHTFRKRCCLRSKSLTGLQFTTKKKKREIAVVVFCFLPRTSNVHRIVCV